MLTSPPGSSDALARFYTAQYISELLIRLMTAEGPETIVDLGAGSGSLSAAARRRWCDAAIVTVDLDVGVRPSLIGAIARGTLEVGHRHVCADVLDWNLPRMLDMDGRGFDAAVCNPPYLRPRWRPSFERILDDAGLLPALSGVVRAADILFIAQSLRMVRDNGQVGLIVPDGLVAGNRTAKLREVLLETHRIERVVQLPRCAFINTDAQTYIMILTKGMRGDAAIELHKLDNDGTLSHPVRIGKAEAVTRLDYDFHAVRNCSSALIAAGRRWNLASAGAIISRGTLNSRQARCAPFPVFHIQHFPKQDKTEFEVSDDLRLPEMGAEINGVTVAGPGDILLARVGRDLQQKVCLIRSGQVAISDWIYRIRVGVAWRYTIAEALLSQRGQLELAAHSHGVGPCHLPKATLLAVPLPTPISMEGR